MEENTNETQAQQSAQQPEEGAQEMRYTPDEVRKWLQSETDQRVNQALEKQRGEFEKQLRLASLDGQERVMAEKDLRIAQLEEQAREYAQFKTRSDMMRALSQRGLDPAFADMLRVPEGQDVSRAADALDKLVKSAVQEGVRARLAASAPRLPAGGESAMTREAFRALPLNRRAELYRENPDLYKQLTE